MREFWYDVGDVIMAISMFEALAFAVSYAVFFRWRKTAAGRSLMYFVGALVLWAGISTLTRFVGDYPAREFIRIIVYLAIAIAMGRMVFTLWRSWRHTPQKIKPRPTREHPVDEDTEDPREGTS